MHLIACLPQVMRISPHSTTVKSTTAKVIIQKLRREVSPVEQYTIDCEYLRSVQKTMFTRRGRQMVQKYPLFVNVYTIENVNTGGQVVKKSQNLVNVVCERSLTLFSNSIQMNERIKDLLPQNAKAANKWFKLLVYFTALYSSLKGSMQFCLSAYYANVIFIVSGF